MSQKDERGPRIVAILKRFWWPHPYARPRLWRTWAIGYRYFINGAEVSSTGESIDKRPGRKKGPGAVQKRMPRGIEQKKRWRFRF